MRFRSRWSVGFLAAAALSVMSPSLHAQRDAGLVVYNDFDFHGRGVRIDHDMPDLRVEGLANQISSLRVAPGERWEICERKDYGGRCDTVSGDIPNLARYGWNNVISSVRRARGAIEPGRPEGWMVPTGNLELFAGTGFSGRRVVLAGPTADFRPLNFNDRALSLHTFRGEPWEVCVNINFDDCRVVQGDVPDLGRLGLERGISSARPRGVGRAALPPPRVGTLELFAGTDFSGERYVVEGPTPDLQRRGFNDRAMSLRVPRGQRWEVCINSNFDDCRVVEGDLPDLSAIGLLHMISSARPHR